MKNIKQNIVESFNFNKVKVVDDPESASNVLVHKSTTEAISKICKNMRDYQSNTKKYLDFFRDFKIDDALFDLKTSAFKFISTYYGRCIYAKADENNDLVLYPKTSNNIIILPFLNCIENFSEYFSKELHVRGIKLKSKILMIDFSYYETEYPLTYDMFLEFTKYTKDTEVFDLHNAIFKTYDDYLKIRNYKKQIVTITYTSKNSTSYIKLASLKNEI